MITAIVCTALILTVLTNPSIHVGKVQIHIFYWTAPVVGSIALLLFRLLPVSEMWKGLTSSGSINPLKILTLFISMTTLSIYLDEVGFFSYVAGISLKAARTSQRKLFCMLFLIVSILTVFTSNDTVSYTHLTLPTICSV